MDVTEKLLEKYPEYIVEKVRQRLDLEPYDTSKDKNILNMTPNQIFSHVTKWEGLMGSYDYQIKEWVNLIYGVDLNSHSDREGVTEADIHNMKNTSILLMAQHLAHVLDNSLVHEDTTLFDFIKRYLPDLRSQGD